MNRLDRRQLRISPLVSRKNSLDIHAIAISPDDTTPALDARVAAQVAQAAARVRAARAAGQSVMLVYGAHLIKNGLAPVLIRLIEEGWVTHLATNGAGSIHDWEFAFQGCSGEDVRTNTARGEFGTWDETGRYINLALAVGGIDGLGYGASVGKMIVEDGLTLPTVDALRAELATATGDRLGALADLLALMTEFDLPSGRMEIAHPHRVYSVQAAAYAHGVPLTIHPGIGYDIIYTHPLNSGGAIGRAAVRDFLAYAAGVSRLEHGIHFAVGSAIMAPMIFEKSLSMANNLSLQQIGRPLQDYYLVVNDIQPGGDWDWSAGEPPHNNPAYYLRFCKTFNRMGGTLDYVCADNRAFVCGLYRELAG